MEENSFGQILINNNFINQPELEKCLEIQGKLKEPKLLGEILVDEGCITRSILNSILSIQRRRIDLSQEDEKTVRHDEIGGLIREGDLLGFLELVKKVSASDLYIITDAKPVVRIHGNLVDLDYTPLTADEVQEMIFQALAEDERVNFFKNPDFERSIDLKEGGRCRMNVFKDYRGFGAVIRIFADDVQSLDDLGFPAVIRNLAKLNRGLILVTGPISSGKSTTLVALVDEINRTRKGHIITIENPIEVVYESKGCIITQREVGKHTNSFSVALRAALREDPDFIVISELRDLESILTAIQAAETGHLVMGTLPTASAVRTLHRIIDVFPEAQQPQIRSMLSGTLKAVISQQLIPNIDGKGRSLSQEILVTTPAVANFIRENKTYQIPSAIQLGKEHGMQLMDDSMMELVHAKRISVEEAYFRADNKDKFMNLSL